MTAATQSHHPLRISDGSLEALKWIGLLLMTVSHINRYLFDDSLPWLTELGRPAMPIFAVVLAYNLARPGASPAGTYQRTLTRLLLWGAIATLPYIALGPVIGGWWPLNILLTLATSTLVLWSLDRGGSGHRLFAVFVFLVGGAFVEYWWPGLLIGIAYWHYLKRPTWFRATGFLMAVSSLWLVNGNGWALAALPLLLLATRSEIKVRRCPLCFYIYYPLHLGALYVAR
jgi:hypothetical protein